jgi:hypothetical protein
MELTLGALYNNLQNLGFLDLAEQTTQDTAEQLLDWNKKQLYQGRSAEGDAMEPYKWESYAEQKHNMNPLPGFGFPDYKLTGAFYEAFKIEVTDGVAHVFSTDSKAEKLEKREGGMDANFEGNQQLGADRLYGLDPISQGGYLEQDFQPVYYEHIHRALKLI